MKFYYGVASIQLKDTLAHHFGYGLCESNGELVAKLVERAFKQLPGGHIVNAVAFAIPAAEIIRFAERLQMSGTEVPPAG